MKVSQSILYSCCGDSTIFFGIRTFLEAFLTINIIAQTPLNEINNYLEMALENNADDYTRIIVSEAQRATKSLGTIVDTLLKLTEAEEGSMKAADATFNLKLTGKPFFKSYDVMIF